MIFSEHNSAEDFWKFSAYFYDKGDVKKHCLNLQNSFAIDVNLILLFCWLVQKGFGNLEPKVITELSKISDIWQKEILGPMRLVRKQIDNIDGDEAKHVYKSLLASELKAEKTEQAVLIQSLNGKNLSKINKAPCNHLTNNLELYFLTLKVNFDEECLESVKYIIQNSCE
ncbi:MAG: TIGR02444 family protein [Sphingomonadales bacterium]